MSKNLKEKGLSEDYSYFSLIFSDLRYSFICSENWSTWSSAENFHYEIMKKGALWNIFFYFIN